MRDEEDPVMMITTLSLAIFSVSMVFSMMGSGGSQILIPILFWLGLDFKSAAIPLGLMTSAVTLLVAGLVYYRRGLVRFSIAWPFALAVLAGSPAGAALSRPVSSRALVVTFAIVNIVVGLMILRGRGLVRKTGRRTEVFVALAGGLGIGFLVGFVARDGGPFTVALLLLSGMDVREAAGTAPVILAGGCLAAFAVHALRMDVPAAMLISGAGSALAGAWLGSRFMTKRLESRSIRVLLSSVMVLSGAVIMLQAFKGS